MQQGDGPDGFPSQRHALWITLTALLALAAFTQWMYTPPAPLPADAAPQLFSAQRAAGVLKELVGDGIPHPLASAADARIRAQLVARLNALGYATELQSGWSCDPALACGWVVNVIARLAGTDPASGAVLLASHYDSVPAGPGAGDDGVGVASVLEIARVLKQQPALRHPIILLIDEGEEMALLGAKLFVDAHPAARTVRAVVNLDARGDSGPSLMFETGAATDWTMSLFARAVARPMSNSLYYFIYTLLPNDTDFTIFKAAGFEGLNFALIGNVERYHTPQDNFANLDLRSLQHQGQNALAGVQALATADLARLPAAGAVFFDVFGRTLVHWPAAWSALLGIVLAAALLGALWVVRRRARVSVAALLHAFAAWLIGWLIVIGVAAALLSVARTSGAVPPAEAYSWAAYPLGMHAACIALALLAPACAVRLSRRRASSWSLWLVNALVIGALMLLCSVKYPELSFLFVLPALATLPAAYLAVRALPGSTGAMTGVPPWVAVLPVLVAAFAFVPILLMLYPALGADAWPILTAVAGLVLLGLAPLLHDTPAGSYRAYVWLSIFTVVLGGGYTVLRPPYSTHMPQRTLLWYALDADAGRAQWVLQPDSKRDAPRLALRDDAAMLTSTLPAGIISGVHSAAAPRLDYAAPELQVLSAELNDGKAVYRLRLRSPRGAAELELAIPEDRPVKATLVSGNGRRLPVKFWRAADHTRWLQLIGAPSEGVELELETPTADDLALKLIDRSYGLPAAGAGLRPGGPSVTTASQDGDLTIVHRSLVLSLPQRAANP